MTRDDIIRMARETGMISDSHASGMISFLERFASLVAAAEREACAKEKTEHYPGEYGSEYDAGQGNAISECVDAIRARSEE